jgi:nitrogenase molybdenum-cofactor synthesis protein NifE
MMNDRLDISALKTLDKIKKDYDVKRVAHAFYPGLHCPLFASVAMASQIDDLYILVVGTEECAFYSKNLTSRLKADHRRLFSFVLDKNDIAFGCGEKLAEAVREIYGEEDCGALLVVSTCVTELIGEDFSVLLDELEWELDLPILLVRTNHYQKDTPLQGISETLSALVKLMDRQIKIPKTVNILGHRFEDFEHTELGRLLEKSGIAVNVRIPTKCDIGTLREAPSAQLNIVTNFAALDLAEKMKAEFQVDYVYFEKFTDPERIKSCYADLQSHLDIDISDDVDKMYAELTGRMSALKSVVRDKTFVFGMPPMFAYEITSFFCKLGMKPLWIQALGLREDEITYKNEILEYANPKVFRALDIPFIRQISARERPDYCFTGRDDVREETDYVKIEMMEDIKGLGFEVPLGILKRLGNSKDGRGR